MLSVVLGCFDLLFAQTVVDWFIGKSLWREVCTLVPGTDWSIPAWGGCLESMRDLVKRRETEPLIRVISQDLCSVEERVAAVWNGFCS